MSVGGSLLVGVEVGGTKIAVFVTTSDGTVLGRATASSAGDPDRAAEATIATVETALADAGAQLGGMACTHVTTPSPLDRRPAAHRVSGRLRVRRLRFHR